MSLMADVLRGFAVLVWLQYLVQIKEFLQVIPSPPFEIFISEKISPVDNSSLTTSLLSGHYRSSFHPPLFLFPLSFRSQKEHFLHQLRTASPWKSCPSRLFGSLLPPLKFSKLLLSRVFQKSLTLFPSGWRPSLPPSSFSLMVVSPLVLGDNSMVLLISKAFEKVQQ